MNFLGLDAGCFKRILIGFPIPSAAFEFAQSSLPYNILPGFNGSCTLNYLN